MLAMSAAVLPGGRPSVKRLLFAVFPAARKNVRCPNLLSLLLLVFCSSFRAVSVNLPALRPPFCGLYCTVSSGKTCLLQNMDFSCCLARGGIEPPLLAERRFTSRVRSPELRTMRKGLALAVFYCSSSSGAFSGASCAAPVSVTSKIPSGSGDSSSTSPVLISCAAFSAAGDALL